MFIVSIISFIVLFSFIVLIHEWGHYRSAIRHWVKVEEFWLWLPPRAKTLWKNKSWTKFTLNWIPFWGFVRMFWEDSTDLKDRKKKWSFWTISLLWRMEIVLAWVFMNFILAWWLLIILFTIWTEPIMLSKTDFEKQIQQWNIIMENFDWVKIITLTEDWLWKISWFEAWDIISKINWKIISKVTDISAIQAPWLSLSYEVKRWDSILNIPVILDETWKLWTQITAWPVLKEIKKIKMWFFDSIIFSFKECFRIWTSTVKMFWEIIVNIFTKWATPDWVAWPIWIAQMTSVFVSAWDFNWLIKFMALISLSLAVINLMPIPALDWWRFVFLLIEWIIRKPVPVIWETYIHLWWYIFLMWLIFLVSIQDILRLIW